VDKIAKIWERLLKLTNNLESVDAKIIDINTVETGMWTLLKCKYGCNNFGKSLGCPPHTPTADEMKKVLDCYNSGILIQTKDDMKTINEIVVELEYFALDLEFFKAFGLGAGRCRLCEKCNLGECINPKVHRPSMEACGIDVQSTAINNGYNEMIALENGKKVYYCYGLLLID
jgi:predicted metal-binding protein